jgi:hypothetical protein
MARRAKPPGLLDAGAVYQQLARPRAYSLYDDGKSKFYQPPKKDDDEVKALIRHVHVTEISRRRGAGSSRTYIPEVVDPFTLKAGAGSFALTGEDMIPVTSRTVQVGAGAFALAGQSADLKKTAAVGAYKGPGEETGWDTAYGYWGLRAYNASKIGANCIDVCANQVGAAVSLTTVVIGANGYADLTPIGFSPIYVNRIYDQGTGGQDIFFNNGSPGRVELTPSMVGGKPAMLFSGGIWGSSTGVATALSQPLTIATVVRQNTFVQDGEIITDGSFAFQPLIFQNGNIGQYFGVFVHGHTNGVAVNAFGSFISHANNASSTLCINGAAPTTVSGGVGTNGIGTTNKLTIGGTDSGGALFNGYIYEILVKSGVRSAAEQTAMSVNQHTIGSGW